MRLYSQEILTCYECPNYDGDCTAFEEDMKIYDASMIQHYCPLLKKMGSEEVVDRRRDFHIYYYYNYVNGVPPWKQHSDEVITRQEYYPMIEKDTKRSLKNSLKNLIKNNKIKINQDIWSKG